MSTYKKRNRAGAVRWGFMFGLPGATRKDRRRISESGFDTKREAADAEARRRIQEHQKRELQKAGSGVAAKPPTTLIMLLNEFFKKHVDTKLAPKTVERYHQEAGYLDPELLKMPLTGITPLHLGREWKRLSECGGRNRRTKQPRPLSAKTVRNIARVVSSAFARAIRWGLVATNPVTNSEPPRVKKHYGVALTVTQQTTLSKRSPGLGARRCSSTYLQLSARDAERC